MGAPCSRKLTWAEYEFFECFHSRTKSIEGLRPSFSAHVSLREHGAPIKFSLVLEFRVLARTTWRLAPIEKLLSPAQGRERSTVNPSELQSTGFVEPIHVHS